MNNFFKKNYINSLKINNNIMTIKGTIKEIYDIVQVKDNFRKREFVVEYAQNPDYPQFVKFEMIQDACDQLNNFKFGDKVKVDFDLQGRAWVNPKGETVYFNTLRAWKVTNDSSSDTQGSETEFNEIPNEDVPF